MYLDQNGFETALTCSASARQGPNPRLVHRRRKVGLLVLDRVFLNIVCNEGCNVRQYICSSCSRPDKQILGRICLEISFPGSGDLGFEDIGVALKRVVPHTDHGLRSV